MLLLLTGNVQIGKTRWLERTLARLAERGVPSAGVVAPGDWRPDSEMPGGFEKLGIDNVLLPGGERFPFARRRDLAQEDGTFDAGSQSARAGLGWEISDAAIARVNRHFSLLSSLASQAAESPFLGAPGMLVVDELGRLELMRGEGLVDAMALVSRGPSASFPHALVVVREDLCACALDQLSPAWEDARLVRPDEDSARMLLSLFDTGCEESM